MENRGKKPKDRPPPPPGPHWFQKGDRNRSEPPPGRSREREPVESTPETVCTLVYLLLGKQGIRDMITAVHDYDGLVTGSGSDPSIKKGP